MLAGCFNDAIYDTSEADISPGDRVILYTDGITEAFDRKRKEVGEEKFGDLALKYIDHTPEEFLDNLIIEIQKYTGREQFDDDVTIIVADVVDI